MDGQQQRHRIDGNATLPEDEDEADDEVDDYAGPLTCTNNSISSKTNKLTLSSPLLDNSEKFGSRKADNRIPIYDDKKLKLVNANGPGGDEVKQDASIYFKPTRNQSQEFHQQQSLNMDPGSAVASTNKADVLKDFRRPPLKPSMTSGSINCKKNTRNNLGNPFYKPPSIGSCNSVLTINDLESPSKKRKVSFNNSVSSFESLLSLHNKQQEFNGQECNGDTCDEQSHSQQVPTTTNPHSHPKHISGLTQPPPSQPSQHRHLPNREQFMSTDPTSESSFNDDSDDDNDPHYNYYDENNDTHL